MVDKKATFIIELKDLATAGLNKLKNNYENIRNIITVLGSAIAYSVKQWADEEATVAKLNQTLANNGENVSVASERLHNLALELQKTTKFSDDATLGMQNMLATFGLTSSEILKLTPRVQDLATATGLDLQSAAIQLSKAITTQSADGFRLYGKLLDDSAFKTGNLDDVIQELDKHFRNQAVTAGQTLSGQIIILKNTFDELTKTVGGKVAPTITKFFNFLTSSIQKVPDSLAIIGQAFLDLVPSLKKIMAIIGVIIPGFGLLTKAVDKTADGIKGFIDNLNKSKKVNDEVVDKIISKRREMSDKMIMENEKNRKDVERILKAHMSAYISFSEQWLGITISWQTTFQEVTKQMTSAFSGAVANWIVYGGSFKDKMEEIGRSMLEFFIKEVIEQMVARWIAANIVMTEASVAAGTASSIAWGATLAAMGPVILAIAAIAAAIAVVVNNWEKLKETVEKPWKFLGGETGGNFFNDIGNTIAKPFKKLFSGGVINEPTAMIGMRTGAIGLAGEKGIPEALISFPEMGLSPSQGRERLLGKDGGGGNGGGNTIININAGTLVADDASLRILAKKIDEKLYELQRNRKTVSI